MAKMQLGMEFAQAFRNTDIKIAIIGNDAHPGGPPFL